MASRKSERDRSFSIRVDLHSDGARGEELSERINAQCWGAGAEGIEERSESGCISLILYTREEKLADVLEAAKRELFGAGDPEGGMEEGADGGMLGEIGEPERVEEQDWSEAWKHGLDAIEVSSRLVVRPSFVDYELARGQREVVIDPGQAFGTGGHASTLLALEWVDALADEFHARTRVLDVGTGTGVLAFAALQLGAGLAVGFDLDPIAVQEARVWAEHNGLGERFSAFTGGIEALEGKTFELVIANLLRTELMPLVPAIVERTAQGGEIVLSGLLDVDQETVLSAFAKERVVCEDLRDVVDESGARWVSLLLRRDY